MGCALRTFARNPVTHEYGPEVSKGSDSKDGAVSVRNIVLSCCPAIDKCSPTERKPHRIAQLYSNNGAHKAREMISL